MKEKDRPEIIPGNFPFPLSKGKGESKYLTWLRNHSDYMATRGFLDYMRAIGVLIRGILVNFLAVLPSLLVLSVFIAWFFKPFFDQRKPITNLHGDTLVYTLEQTGPKKLEQGGDAIINPLTRKYWFTRSGPDYAKLNVSIVKPNEEAQESLNIDPESERTKGRGIFVVEEAELLYQDPAGKGPFRIGKLIKSSSDELEIEFSTDVTPDVITDLVHSIAFESKSSTVVEELRDVEFTLMGADSQKKKWKATVTVDRIGRLMELPADDGESSVSLIGIFRKVGDIARGIRDGFGHDPFSLTSLVLVLSTALVLLFPVGSRLCRIVGYRKIKETGKGSSVKQRDKVERMFGGALLAILIAIMIGVLPWLIDEYHRINVRDGQGYLLFAGIIAILLIANKMLAGLSGAKKVLMMALVAIAGMLAPFLVVVNTTRFLAYSNTTPGAKWFLLIVIPVVFLVAIGLAGLLGVCKRSITFSGFFIKLPLIAAGIIGATVLFPILGIILFTGDEISDLMNLAKAVPEGMGGGEYMNAIMKKVGEAIHQNASPVFILSVAFQIWLFCWLALDINSTSVHGLYRDRLASAYLVGRNTDDEVDIEDDVNLYEICRYEDGATAPYHLVNVALNLQGSKNPNLRDRQSDFFFFSRLYTGGESTGYCDTKTMETIHPSMTLATAMAISAAAASPNMGRGTSGAMVAFLTLLNVRLGYWLPNPGVIAQIEGKRKDASINKLATTLFGSLFSKQDEDDEPMTWRQIKSRRKMTRKYVPGYDFDKVLTDELGQIQKRRKNGGQLSPVYLPEGDTDVLAAAFKSELVGLGFSGGGIRSATINLGIVQMLHECGIFEKVDYMSTVSGGGYLGSSISTLMRSKDCPDEVDEKSPPKEAKRVKNRTYWQMFKWRIRPSAFVNELRSILNETGKWVNLSDGGHIENLAGIELLRRRCKFVIIGDGEADPNLSFNGLATLVRYARIDLGITIDIDVEPIRLDRSEGTLSSGKGALSDAHFAFGTIKYPGETEPGYLLYLKSSYTGDEDVVIQEYRYRNPDFPHESTADQSFDEGQFEAYRALGQHIAENALEAMGENAAFSAKFSDPEA